MKPLNPDRPRVDSRGLPEGFDPRYFYEYRFQKASEKATGVERLLYQYIPVSLVKSVAFAIDPTARFKVAPGIITAVNRKKYRSTASILQQRKKQNFRMNSSYNSSVNYQGIGGCRGPIFYNTPNINRWTEGLRTQDPLPDILDDTTTRTRAIGSTQGELKMFKSSLRSPYRKAWYYKTNSSYFDDGNTPPPGDNCITAGGHYWNKDGGMETIEETFGPSAATLSISTFNERRYLEFKYNDDLIKSHLSGLLKQYGPKNRQMPLFRSIVELRDLPRSVASLRQTMGDLKQLFTSLSLRSDFSAVKTSLGKVGKDIPNEYLSYHFGWKQTYKDLMELLSLPEKISKRVNFLLARSGKPTTFRYSRKFVSGESGVSGFEYDRTGLDNNPTVISSRIERESELRLVINSTFDFPPVDLPSFKVQRFAKYVGIDPKYLSQTYIRMYGVEPSITDIYNLVPWTWLFDWFTGLGKYVECIDNINHDDSLINWGLITCDSTGRLITDFSTNHQRQQTYYFNNTKIIDETNLSQVNHQSVLDFTCQTRKNVANVLDVKLITEPSTLSSFQLSILGALLAQRTKFTRSQNSSD